MKVLGTHMASVALGGQGLAKVNTGVAIAKYGAIAAAIAAAFYAAKEGIIALADTHLDSSEVTNSLLGITNGTTALEGALGDAVKTKASFDELMSKLAGAGEARDNISKDWWNVGVLIEQGSEVLMNGMDDAFQQFDKLSSSLSELAASDLPKAQQSFVSLAEAMGAVDDDQMQQLLDMMPEYKTSLLDAANAAGISVDETDLLALATGKLVIAQDDAGNSTLELTDATDDASSAVEEYNVQLTNQIDLLRKAAGIALSVREAQVGFEQSLHDATEALKENGATLDITTEAGRKNDEALRGIAEAGWELVDSLAQDGASVEELQAAMGRGRDEFIRTATQMGINETQAKAMADQYGLTPATITTTMVLDTSSASKNLAGWLARVPVITAELRTSSGYYANRADGGGIWGPGTTTSDSIPIMASNNEHMWSAREVAGAGGHGVMEEMRAAARNGRFPGFADGGAIEYGALARGLSTGTGFSGIPALGSGGGLRDQGSSTGAGDTFINLTVNNPKPEPASDTLARQVRRMARTNNGGN
jgi:hypothetical protein